MAMDVLSSDTPYAGALAASVKAFHQCIEAAGAAARIPAPPQPAPEEKKPAALESDDRKRYTSPDTHAPLNANAKINANSAAPGDHDP
jgi:hypothetical protein